MRSPSPARHPWYRCVLLSLSAVHSRRLPLTRIGSIRPRHTQCQPVQLSWADGVAPFYVAIIPGNEPAGAALAQLDTQQGMSVTW